MCGDLTIGRINRWVIGVLLLLTLVGCGASEPVEPANPPPRPVQPLPTATDTPAVATLSIEPSPTATTLPTAPPTATPIPPTPIPEPDVATIIEYTVEPGDTLTWIQELFGVYRKERRNADLAYIAALNEIEDINLIYPGQVLRIPINLHVVVPGDSLPAIAALRDTTVPDLIALNPGVLDDSEVLIAGTALRIRPNTVQRPLNCAPYTTSLPTESAETQLVFTETIRTQEQLLCLHQIYGLSAATLFKLQPQYRTAVATNDFGTEGLEFIIPTTNGGGFLVSEEEMTLDYIASYYSVPVDQLYYWNGDSVTSRPLNIGDSVFAIGADLRRKEAYGSAPGPAQSVALVQVEQGTDVVLSASPATGLDPLYTQIPSGDPPPGATMPEGQPIWRTGPEEAGWCDPQAGFGWTGAPLWPTDSRTINPNRGFNGTHPAIDIVGQIDDPIYAAESGVVIWAGPNRRSAGNIVVLGHGNTWQTHYVHLNSVTVSCGQVVNRGDLIGTMGQAGLVHLHFSIRWQGFAFNPLDYLP